MLRKEQLEKAERAGVLCETRRQKREQQLTIDDVLPD